MDSTLRDGASDVVLLFEMVGAVSLRWNGTAHETWEREGKSIIMWVSVPTLGMTGARSTTTPPSSGFLQPPTAVPMVMSLDPASKHPIFWALCSPQIEPQRN